MLVCVQVSVPRVSTLMTASPPACCVHWEHTSQKWDAPPASLAEETWSPSAVAPLLFRSVRPKVRQSSLLPRKTLITLMLFCFSSFNKIDGLDGASVAKNVYENLSDLLDKEKLQLLTKADFLDSVSF